jgi:hypothetical protein
MPARTTFLAPDLPFVKGGSRAGFSKIGMSKRMQKGSGFGNLKVSAFERQLCGISARISRPGKIIIVL